jgi:hypothetical protein
MLSVLPSNFTSADWQAAMESTLGFRNCRWLTVLNFETLAANPNAYAAIDAVLQEEPSCLVDAATQLSVSESADGMWDLSWIPSEDFETQTLLAATVPFTSTIGMLSSPTIANRPAASISNDTISISPLLRNQVKAIFWQIVTCGCGGTQKMVSDVFIISL